MSRLLTCLIVVGLSGPVVACINDVELPTHEREFRSQYLASSASPPSPKGTPGGPIDDRLIVGVGSALLLAGFVVAASGGRSRG